MNGFIGKALPLGPEDVGTVAEKIGVEEAALRAVLSVETNGKGFDKSNRPKALFERHVFYRLLKNKPDTLNLALNAGLAYKDWGTKPYPLTSDGVYAEIEAAYEMAPSEALQSTSWGLGQIMGENYKVIGYDAPETMVQDAMDSEINQLRQMAKFIKANGLVAPLVEKNWAAFAKRYNGPGYAQNKYDVKLAEAYQRWATEA